MDKKKLAIKKVLNLLKDIEKLYDNEIKSETIKEETNEKQICEVCKKEVEILVPISFLSAKTNCTTATLVCKNCYLEHKTLIEKQEKELKEATNEIYEKYYDKLNKFYIDKE